MPVELQKKIRFVAMTEDNDRHGVLKDIKNNFLEGSYQNNMDVNQLENHMIEEFDAITHNIII